MKQIKLVVCDIDGTLVNGKRQLTAVTQQTLAKLYQQGIWFAIASGRPTDEVQASIINWNLGFPVAAIIAMNGSELTDNITGQRQDFFKLKKEWIKEIIEKMKPYSQYPYIYRDGEIWCLEDNDIIAQSARRAHKNVRLVDSVDVMYEQDNGKVMFRMPEEQVLEVEKMYGNNPKLNYKAFKTQATLIEFAHKDVSKAYALKVFCQNHQIDLSEVMSFGDTTNDNDLLTVSGWGVCLQNGSNDTKKIANAITPYTNDEDGVAKYLQQHILNQN